MVMTKFFKIEDGVRYYITNSSLNKYIIRQDDGMMFKEVIEPEGNVHTYREIDLTIEEVENE